MSYATPPGSDKPTPAAVPYRLRKPQIPDAAQIDLLIRRSPPLDTNSGYLYLLLCHHHADTCAVAEREGDIVGFVSGYIPPRQPDTLFIWQVAVDGSMRGQGLAAKLLDELLSRDSCRGVRHLETTVSPSNRASRRLFEKWAERRGAKLEDSPLFPSDLFADPAHEDEVLLRIGPF